MAATLSVPSRASLSAGSRFSSWGDFSSPSRDVSNTSLNDLLAQQKRLEERARTGDITPAQAARLREIQIAIQGIRVAQRGGW